MLSKNEVEAWVSIDKKLDLLEEYEQIDNMQYCSLGNQNLMASEEVFSRYI